MLNLGHVSVLQAIGTAEGRCLGCGTYFFVAVPDDRSPAEALLAVFDKHLAETHEEEAEADVSHAFAIAA